MPLPLRGRVEDQTLEKFSTSTRAVLGRAVPDAGERAAGRLLLRDGSRHRRPPAAAGRAPTRTGRSRSTRDGIAARWNAIRQEFVDYYRPSRLGRRGRPGGLRAVAARRPNGPTTSSAKQARRVPQGERRRHCRLFRRAGPVRERQGTQPDGPVPEAAPLGPDDGTAGRGRQVDQGHRRPGMAFKNTLVQPAGRRSRRSAAGCRPVGTRSAGTAWSRSTSP